MAAPRAIVFDCWGTLFTSDLRVSLRRIASMLGAEYNETFSKVFERYFMLQPHDDLAAPVAQLAQAYALAPTPELMQRIITELELGIERQRPYPETIDMLERLHDQYRLGLMTNSFSKSFDHLRTMYHLDTYFDVIVPSYEVGLLKPNKAIFELALERLGVTADQAVMVGDSLEDDIQGASRVGLRGLLLDRAGSRGNYPGKLTKLTDLGKILVS